LKNYARFPCATFLFSCLSAQALSTEAPAWVKPSAATIQVRIKRVEGGLCTPVVVKGAPDQKKKLIDRMAFYQIPAVSIALINHGKVEWSRAYGLADVARHRPATVNTLFQAGSISKALSAIGALRLVEQGRLALDERVNRQLRSWTIPENEFTRAKPVTLRMLLNHSAGVTVHGFDGYERGHALPTLTQVLNGSPPANSAPVRVDVTPGTIWRYSGGGYSIVQLMMIEASDQPFDRYMKSAVLKPLGMGRSTFAVPLAIPPDRDVASAYDSAGNAVAGRWHSYPESAAAGLWSTPNDLARVVLAIQEVESGIHQTILSRNSVKTMLTRELGEYGLGFFVEDLGNRTSFSHEGGTAGYRSQIYGYTSSGQGIVVMTNSDNGGALIQEILCSVAAEYGWPEYHVIEKTAVVGNAERNRDLAGDYQLVNMPAHIVAEGSHLYFESALFGGKRMEIFPQSDLTFFMTDQDMSIRFHEVADRPADGFDLLRGSNTYTAKRTD
jgi:CubicO group peptidase (beta-lactamase class C family)